MGKVPNDDSSRLRSLRAYTSLGRATSDISEVQNSIRTTHKTVSNRMVMLQVQSNLIDGQISKEQLRREIVRMGKQKHPNLSIPTEVEFDLGGNLLLIGSQIKGLSLLELLCQHHTLTPRDALRVLQQVAAAQDHAHAHHFAHVVLEPAQIRIKFTDQDVRTLASSVLPSFLVKVPALPVTPALEIRNLTDCSGDIPTLVKGRNCDASLVPLTRELLGHPFRNATDCRCSPISTLSEAANMLLQQRAASQPAEWGGSLAFVNALAAAQGIALNNLPDVSPVHPFDDSAIVTKSIKSKPIPAPAPTPLPPDEIQAVKAVGNLSAAVRYLWQTAAAEAHRSKHHRIEPGHFLIGLCRLTQPTRANDPSDFSLETQSIRRILADSGCTPAELCRALRAEIGIGSASKTQLRTYISRSTASLAMFSRAISYTYSHSVPSATLTSLHLLAALLDDSEKDLTKTLRRMGGNPNVCRLAALAAVASVDHPPAINSHPQNALTRKSRRSPSPNL